LLKLVRGDRLGDIGWRAWFEERLRIFDRLCDAVAFAHASGVVHRDLKPENIMIGAFGEVLVLDWGAAALRDAPPAGRAVAIGTPGYMAPEQAAGTTSFDERVDIYALGGILEALFAPAPVAGSPAPRAIQAIVTRARHPNPEERYQTVAALAADVRRFSAALPVEAHRESPLERLQRVGRRYRIPILLVTAYLLIRILLLFV
jgi:serine/threonine protein kinase